MKTLTKLYPLLKDIGLNDQKSQDFIEIIEESYYVKVEHEIKGLVNNETFQNETNKIRLEIANVREELAKELAKVRSEMADMKIEMANVKIEMSNMKVDLIKWNVGTILAVAALVTAIVKLLG